MRSPRGVGDGISEERIQRSCAATRQLWSKTWSTTTLTQGEPMALAPLTPSFVGHSGTTRICASTAQPLEP